MKADPFVPLEERHNGRHESILKKDRILNDSILFIFPTFDE